MRPKTMSFGSLMTNRTRLDRTRTFNRTFVPSPKNAFQSPGTHSRGRSALALDCCCISSSTPPAFTPPAFDAPPSRQSANGGSRRRGLAARGGREGFEEALRIADPTEDPALGLDHLEGDALELREVGRDGVGQDERVIAAIVGLADARVDADLGRHAAHDELPDALHLQDRVEVRGVEGALARLVDDRLSVDGVDLLDDVVAELAADEDPPHRPDVADRRLAPAANLLRMRQVRE